MLGLEAETVITLEDGAVWLGMPEVALSDLYVRRCYIELFQAREAYIKARGWEGMGPISCYTGTPGVCRDPWSYPTFSKCHDVCLSWEGLVGGVYMCRRGQDSRSSAICSTAAAVRKRRLAGEAQWNARHTTAALLLDHEYRSGLPPVSFSTQTAIELCLLLGPKSCSMQGMCSTPKAGKRQGSA